MSKKEIILAEVIQQIEQDLRNSHSDALYALLMSVSTNQLVEFLPKGTQRSLAVVDHKLPISYNN